MSQRAAWQLERLGFRDVYDFVHGKVYWLASGRATIRQHGAARVGENLSGSPFTAELTDTVSSVLERRTASDTRDVIAILSNRVVFGRIRHSTLRGQEPDARVVDVMEIGPTTIRPHELAEDVRGRMAKRSVASLIVTKPTGELLGEFMAHDSEASP